MPRTPMSNSSKDIRLWHEYIPRAEWKTDVCCWLSEQIASSWLQLILFAKSLLRLSNLMASRNYRRAKGRPKGPMWWKWQWWKWQSDENFHHWVLATQPLAVSRALGLLLWVLAPRPLAVCWAPKPLLWVLASRPLAVCFLFFVLQRSPQRHAMHTLYTSLDISQLYIQYISASYPRYLWCSLQRYPRSAKLVYTTQSAKTYDAHSMQYWNNISELMCLKTCYMLQESGRSPQRHATRPNLHKSQRSPQRHALLS